MAIDLHQPAFSMSVGTTEAGSPAAVSGGLKTGQIIETINRRKLILAGVAVPREMQGASWKDIATGKKPAAWRTSFLAQYAKDLGDTPTCVGVRTSGAKLVLYHGKPEFTEIFGLTNDPYELKNLAADPAMMAKLRAELEAQAKAVDYPLPAEARSTKPPAP
jgi:arylsulfatase A-like enzyme